MLRLLIYAVTGICLSFLTRLSSADATAPGFVQLKLQRRDSSDTRKRSTPVEVGLAHSGAVYFIPFTLGTPPQPLWGIVDTGSSDVIVQTNLSDYCRSSASQAELCNDYGTCK